MTDLGFAIYGFTLAAIHVQTSMQGSGSTEELDKTFEDLKTASDQLASAIRIELSSP